MAQACHVQQVLDIAVQTLGLIASAFEQFAAILQGNGFAERQQAVDAAPHGRQRRAQIMGHRGQQGAAQLLGFAVQARRLQILRQLGACQRLGQRLTQRGQQAAALAAQFQPRFRADAEQTQRPVFARQRPPPPAPKGQGAGTLARRLVVLPGPIGGGALGFGEGQRAAGLDFPTALAVAIDQAQIQVAPAFQVVRCRTDHRLAIGGGGEFARQVEQFAGFFLGIAQRLQLSALSCGEVAGQGRHQQEKQQRQHVFFALDGEGKPRWDKQEVVSQERQRRTHQRRAQAAAHRHQQHGGEKHQGDVRQRQYAGYGPCHGGGDDGRDYRQGVVEPDQPTHIRQARRCGDVIAVEHADFQAPRMAQQAHCQAATKQTPPPAHPRLSHQQQAGAAFDGMLDQCLGHLPGTQQHHFATQALGQLLGVLQTQARLLVDRAAVIDMHQAPRQMPALGDAAGMAHQAFGLGIAVHAHQQATAHRRRGLTELAIALGQIVIDVGGGGLHRQFAQGHQVGLGEERIDGCPGLFRHVDLAVAQALEQFAGRQVDQQQFVGFLQHPVRKGFTHLHTGNPAHLIVQTFQMLDVDRGEHIDAGVEQFLNILPALFMAATGGVAVGQLVHQHQLGLGGEQAVEVHLFKHHAAVFAAQQRLLRQAAEQGFCLGAAMGFDHAGDHFDALAQLGVGGLEHGVGLAHTWRGAEEDFEPAAAVAGQIG